MPEGPELARSRDHLRDMLVGKHVHEIIPLEGGRYVKLDDHTVTGLDAFLEECNATAQAEGLRYMRGQPITEVGVKGKFMWWTIGDWNLWCTYGMSGQWSVTYDRKHSAIQVAYNDSPEPVHPCAQLPTINFNDPRHFGTVKLVKGRPALDKKLATLGPDMLNDPPTYEVFRDRLTRSHHVTLAEALMDQTCVSGVGNYIKAESLYLAELSPHRYTDTLTALEMARLREQVINVMRAAYATGGATISTYRNVDGSKGGMKSRFAVYGNKTDPFGNPVVKEETLDGRTTHWCPAIQR